MDPAISDFVVLPLAATTTITSLSEDLLINIIQDDCLDHDDVISLRLVCNSISKAATVVLFRRIHISPLRRDRDAFVSICQSPHLAQYVREVEWQEVSWFPGYFGFIAEISGRQSQYSTHHWILEDDTSHLYDNFDILAADLFWLPVVPHGQDMIDKVPIESQRQDAIDSFRDQFQQALTLLPHLSTFISRSMPANRTLNWCEYPFVMNHFHSHHPYQKASVRDWEPQTNDGLFFFLLPAVQNLSNITRLVWEDQSLAASYMRPPCPEAFQQLDTLALTLVPQLHEPYDNLAANLKAATNVRNLSLAVVEGPSDSHLELSLYQFSPETKKTLWTRLHSLSVESMRHEPKALLGVVRQNADTLRHLYISNCPVTFSQLKKFANIPNLQLVSFRIHDYEFKEDLVTEAALLSSVNAKTTPPTTAMHAETHVFDSMKDSDLIVTHGFVATNDEAVAICGDAESVCSVDSLDCRLQTAPKWIWGRYFHESCFGSVYSYQVPDSDPEGMRTTCWKFTYRDGSMTYGTDPLVCFEDWDPEAGDIEEPTPFCEGLQKFLERDTYLDVSSFLGPAAWKVICNLTPPEGAIACTYKECKEVLEMVDFDL